MLIASCGQRDPGPQLHLHVQPFDLEVQDTLENPELAFWGGVVTGAIFVSLLICLKRRGTKRMVKRGGNTVESGEFMVYIWFTYGESMDNLWLIYG